MINQSQQASAAGEISLGALIRQYRRAAGLSQEQLAESAGIAERTVGNLERNAIHRPQAATLQLIADALHLSPAAHARLTAALHGHRRDPLPPAPLVAVLPAPLTPLIARARELAAVTALVRRADVRLVTITGTGGVGKTRLALAAAAQSAFADGVFFVSLAPVRDPDLFLPSIAQTLGAPLGDRTVSDALATYLRTRQVLLVLDNCEHLLTEMETVTNLLAACPRVQVLATSRAPLRLRGEHVYALAPLAAPAPGQGEHRNVRRYPAVQVFTYYARAAQSAFQITAENAAAVAALCAHLDGLPLALELAATRLQGSTPEALLARLTPRLPALVDGARDVPTRQRTLRDTIAWSYDLLTEAERQVFARFAVFVGGATPEAIVAVAGAGADRHAEVLAAHSLLTLRTGDDGVARYGMLETVREFAWEELGRRGETEETRRRHAAYFVALTEGADAVLVGPEQAAWMRRLDREHNNLRAALHFLRDHRAATDGLRASSEVWRFWHARARQREGAEWLTAFLDLDREAGLAAPDTLRLAALFGAGILWRMANDERRARELFTTLLADARIQGDADGVATALTQLGYIDTAHGEIDTAEARFREAVVLRESLDDPRVTAISLHGLGEVAFLRGDLPRARAYLTRAETMLRTVAATYDLIVVLRDLGVVASRDGNRAGAYSYFAEGLTLAEALNTPMSVEFIEGFAALAAETGAHAWALELAGVAYTAREVHAMYAVGWFAGWLEAALAPAWAALGEAAAARAFAAGEAASVAETIAAIRARMPTFAATAGSDRTCVPAAGRETQACSR